jgi:flagellar protein FliS
MYTSVKTRSAAAYKTVGLETSVANADPHALVRMLFDGLQQALGATLLAMKSKDIALKGKKIGAAVRILDEGLIASLNLEQGGELALNLKSLYEYCVMRLTVANARNDVAAVEEVIRLIEPVANSWKQINGKGPAYLTPV